MNRYRRAALLGVVASCGLWLSCSEKKPEAPAAPVDAGQAAAKPVEGGAAAADGGDAAPDAGAADAGAADAGAAIDSGVADAGQAAAKKKSKSRPKP